MRSLRNDIQNDHIIVGVYLLLLLEALTVSYILSFGLPLLTLIIAWLAFNSNRTSEKVLLTQNLESAEMVVLKLTNHSITWWGHAAILSERDRRLYWDWAWECERAKCYFDIGTEHEFGKLADNARELVIKANSYSSNEHLTPNLHEQFDREASEIRQTLHDVGKPLLKRLLKFRRKYGAGIKLPD